MSWTKRQLVEQAYSELGLSTYAYNLSSHQYQDGLIRMDSMMSQWESRGIKINYPLPDEIGGSDLDNDVVVDVNANEAIYTNLAIKLAPTIGKQVSVETRKTARESYNELLARATIAPATPPAQGTPAGAGNKHDTFLTVPDATTTDEIDIT